MGACTTFAIKWFLPILKKHYPTISITSHAENDGQLIANVLNDTYNLAIVHSQPNNPELYSQHYRDEQILLTLLKNDPLAKKDHLSFKDLTGRSILVHEGANFWLDIFKKNIPKLNLLVQTNMPSLDKIVHDSPIPVFNSSLEIKKHDIPENKITIPIVDKDSFASYYVICKQKDFKKFKALFEFFTSKD
ncbi:LysR family transcriptional regulator substrate-binding protein [Lactobacillus intestinalis]|uniref:LysR family transcriptional regulator substrate-binding protein n=1 Tax=Lactobacillus intestinalis TaxID=151781 RepID=UPI0020CE74D4|nr:LysR family transcriptional regulator substrate-binding protein [Lactobacillus intestinalis]